MTDKADLKMTLGVKGILHFFDAEGNEIQTTPFTGEGKLVDPLEEKDHDSNSGSSR